jgi:REP element-mobilizing transposase RayT
MEENIIQFFTATILEWKHLLKFDKYKNVIISSLEFLVKENRVKIFAFVIMPNHIHIVWQIAQDRKREDVQRDFLKFTAQKIRFDLLDNNSPLLNEFEVDAKDRIIQIWERNPLSVDLINQKMIEQKIIYLHNNPLQEKWNLANEAKDYYFSSAKFYEEEKTEFSFLEDFRDYL